MKMAPKVCGHAGCGTLVHDGSGRCARHQRVAWVRRAPVKRVTGRKLQKLRQQLFARQPLCQHCLREGRVTPATQRDHIVPLAEGGDDADDNVQALCLPCHDRKSQTESARGRRRNIPPGRG